MSQIVELLICKVFNNSLIHLDLNNNTALISLYCNNNSLSSLDIPNSRLLTYIDLSNMPTLNEVCVWTTPFPPGDVHIDTTASPNVFFAKCFVQIPDYAFLNYLIEGGVDTNGDSKISYAEAEAITYLDVSNKKISDMTGIEAFVNLVTLDCSWNELTSLDVSGCKVLTELTCYNNRLTSLDVSGCTALTSLSCGGNQLTSLDVSGCKVLTELTCYNNRLTSLDVSNNTALENLDCRRNQLTSLDVSNITELKYLNCGHYGYGGYGNQLTSLDVSGCKALTSLLCGDNQLTSLDVSNNTALENLDCFGNQLTSLDVSGCKALTSLLCLANQLTSLDVSKNTALENLDCYGNQLTSLDVAGCKALTYLHCDANQLTSLDVSGCAALKRLLCMENQLTSLDVSKNTALENLDCYGNQLTSLDVSGCKALTFLDLSGLPTLYEVCVWRMPFPPGGVNVYKYDSPNVYFNNTCGYNIVGIPNTAFLNALIDEGVDTNGDKLINYVEAEAITYLDVSSKNISDMTGIEAFVNLVTLDCSWNELTSLDISDNKALTKLILSNIPTLHDVCVWEIPFPPAGVEVEASYCPNMYFTADCNLTDLNCLKESHAIDIYPNPSDDIIKIEIENPNKASIEFYNISGNLIFGKIPESKAEIIDISDLPKGIYIIKVIQDNAINVGKVVVR
jgi:Leucine-rich repeat (LRR) protein